MQVSGAVPGASIAHPRRRRNVLLAIAAIVLIAAAVVLVAWVLPFATDRGVAEDVVPKAGAGSAVVHDDAGHVGDLSNPLPHGKVVSDAGSAVVHDDPGNMPATGAGSAVVHDDAGNLTPR